MEGITFAKFKLPFKLNGKPYSDICENPLNHITTFLRFTPIDFSEKVIKFIHDQMYTLEYFGLKPKKIICGKKILEAIATYLYIKEYITGVPTKIFGLDIEYSPNAPVFKILVLPGTIESYVYEEEINKLYSSNNLLYI